MGAAETGAQSGAVSVSANLNGLNYDKSKYSEEDFLNALNQALNSWENVSAVDFVPGGSGSDIEIDVSPLAGATVGSATVWYSNRSGMDRINSVDIDLDEDETWSPYGENGGMDFFAVALHELGHALGLGHINDRSQIMNPVISADGMGGGDVDGIQALYGADLNDSDVPLELSEISTDGPISEAFGNEAPSAAGPDDEDDNGAIGMILAAIVALFALMTGIGAVAGGVAALVAVGKDDTPEVDDDAYLKAFDETGGETLNDLLGLANPGQEVLVHNSTYGDAGHDCGGTCADCQAVHAHAHGHEADQGPHHCA